MMRVSKISEAVKPSLTRKLFNMAGAYGDVVDFTLGDPDVPTHAAIREAGCRAILEGRTRYSQNAGLPGLRRAIADYYMRTEGLGYDPDGEVIATVGAMEGLYLALLSLLDPGDEVIIPAPYYVNYAHMVSLCHARPVIVDSPAADRLGLDVAGVEAAVTPRTRAVIVNTPCNPSGRVLPRGDMEALAGIAVRHGLAVISDEVYRRLLYDGAEFRSIASVPGMRERTVVVNSLSKEFCMTGWRIGYVLAPGELVAAMTRLQENVCACAPLPSQYAAIEALSGKGDYSGGMVDIFARRRDVLVEGVRSIPGLSCEPPQATFYLMADISSTGVGSEEFAVGLLREAHVAVVPGITYGAGCDGYVRIAFTVGEEKIREGVRRTRKYMERYG